MEHNAMQPVNVLTEQEKQAVREYIFLPLIRMALERDRKVINITNTKFKHKYLDMLTEAIHAVTDDMRRNKNVIFDLHIHLTKRNWLSYEVYVRGYRHDVEYHKSVAADWINERVDEYLIWNRG